MGDFIPFSERYGYVNPEEILRKNYENMTENLRISLWNDIIEYIFSKDNSIIEEILKKIWKFYLNKPVENLNIPLIKINPLISKITQFKHTLQSIRKEFKKAKWYKVYDIVEYISLEIAREYDDFSLFQEKVNKTLEKNYAPYRMVEGHITPITNEYEIKAITETFKKADKYQPVKEHLEKALMHLSNRTNPDYVNSIKESISALESLAKIIVGKDESLTGLHQELCKKTKVPKSIRKVIEDHIYDLYKWASSKDGIRHGSSEPKANIGQDEAKLILVQISGLINYFIEKNSFNSGG